MSLQGVGKILLENEKHGYLGLRRKFLCLTLEL